MNLLYDCTYHLHCQLPLASGRIITLERLNQEMTYAGLTLGTPIAQLNTMLIREATRKAQTVSRGLPHLIVPPLRDYLREPGDMSKHALRGSIPEWLPMVTCFASYKCHGQLRDSKKDMSVLTVVWYQDEYAPPILEPALSHLIGLDWDSLAVEVASD